MDEKNRHKGHNLLDDIKRLFPFGTRGNYTKDITQPDLDYWSKYPRWPPDLFAASGFILDKFDGYTLLSRSENELLSEVNYQISLVQNAVEIGQKWRAVLNNDSLEEWKKIHKPKLQALWENFISTSEEVYSNEAIDNNDKLDRLNKIAVELLIIADEASQGIGYYPLDTWVDYIFSFLPYQNSETNQPGITHEETLKNQTDDNWIVNAVEYVVKTVEEINSQPTTPNTKLRKTSCILVNHKEVCVHPKAKVPLVGCTLRSLSKNLSLLPPNTKVEVIWHEHIMDKSSKDSVFNILAIPFPYNIDGSVFVDSSPHSLGTKYNLFSINQKWLHEVDQNNSDGVPVVGDDPHPDTSRAIVSLVKKLLDEAKKHVKKIDVIIFPELALDYHSYKRINDFLTEENRKDLSDKFSLFISGVLHEHENKQYNCAYTSLITDIGTNANRANDSNRTTLQHKHHRWLIDGNQIKQYNIGDSLSPSQLWWENTPIEGRSINFMSFRPEACFTTLICEDLARIDPCHHVVRAVGPNIVFALLMDGAQLKGRWSERYAMGLSDDPGSSVLTLTSLGLVKRSNYYWNSHITNIGLWRDPINGTTELSLPDNHQALLITTNLHTKGIKTLDGREGRGGKSDQVWAFTGCTPLQIDLNELKLKT